VRIVVTHLTRMRAPFICVAGVDLATGDHVRPVLEYGKLERSLLAQQGGLFEIGAVVELGPARCVGRAPEVEDWRFDPTKARKVRHLSTEEMWQWLSLVSRVRLDDIFGDELHQYGKTYVVGLHKGSASLGCLQPVKTPELLVDSYGKLRLHLCDASRSVSLPVTDLRLYEDDQMTLRKADVQRLAEQMAKGARVMLCVGLTRPYPKPGDDVERHWLQVNNIHVRDAHVTRDRRSFDAPARLAKQSNDESAQPERAVAVASPSAPANADAIEHPVTPRLGVDQAIQRAIVSCRHTLPPDRQTAENIADEIARRVRLALNPTPIEEVPSSGKRHIQWQERLTKMRTTHAKAFMPWTRATAWSTGPAC